MSSNPTSLNTNFALRLRQANRPAINVPSRSNANRCWRAERHICKCRRRNRGSSGARYHGEVYGNGSSVDVVPPALSKRKRRHHDLNQSAIQHFTQPPADTMPLNADELLNQSMGPVSLSEGRCAVAVLPYRFSSCRQALAVMTKHCNMSIALIDYAPRSGVIRGVVQPRRAMYGHWMPERRMDIHIVHCPVTVHFICPFPWTFSHCIE